MGGTGIVTSRPQVQGGTSDNLVVGIPPGGGAAVSQRRSWCCCGPSSSFIFVLSLVGRKVVGPGRPVTNKSYFWRSSLVLVLPTLAVYWVGVSRLSTALVHSFQVYWSSLVVLHVSVLATVAQMMAVFFHSCSVVPYAASLSVSFATLLLIFIWPRRSS